MDNIKKIAIVVAMDSELKLIIDSMNISSDTTDKQGFRFIHGKLKDYDDFEIILAKSGIGKVNSAVCATKIIEKFSPDIYLSSGVCGCLNKTPGIKQGDILITVGTTYHDAYCGGTRGQIQDMPLTFPSWKETVNMYKYLKDELYGGIYCCQMISGDWFVDDKVKANEIYNAMCDGDEHVYGIDMESGSISQVCHLYNVPFVGIRIVSDTPLMEGDVPTYEDFWTNAPDTLNKILLGFFDYLKNRQ